MCNAREKKAVGAVYFYGNKPFLLLLVQFLLKVLFSHNYVVYRLLLTSLTGIEDSKQSGAPYPLVLLTFVE